MKHATIIPITLIALLLASSQIACCCCPIPYPNFSPPIEVGEMQERQETIPLAGVESASVEVLFGTGKLEIAAEDSDQLFSGHFTYNVEDWEPQVTFDGNHLTVAQGETNENWGWPMDEAHNEWQLAFSPQVPLKMDVKIGAGEGTLDLSRLQIETLNLDLGAGDFDLRFDEPSETRASRFTLNAGTAEINATGIGNISPEDMRIRGGVGDITLDLTGDWTRSADIEIMAGVGSLTLRLPDDVGVRVEVEGGLTNVSTSGLSRSGNAYVNDAYGASDIELNIRINAGIGQIHLTVASND